MNSKFTRISLFVAAIVVWGLIIYKITISFSTDHNQKIISKLLPISPNRQMPDTFCLMLNYPDPFLGGGFETKKEIIPRPSTRITSVPKTEVSSIPMPQVKYYGLITNKKTQKLVAIINIAGKQYLAKEGNVINDVTLLKMTNDSILIAHEQTKKWIHK
ncbi:MAG: hypothetical protein JXQ69_09370 [Paludibacteraceae bacterium]|nr:hypothetical protein [Paludibacteraceae bacterium]MBN2788515.1 hypothetical protein [Paludibacteraceae bacterium]